jgi:hypothetical protein
LNWRYALPREVTNTRLHSLLMDTDRQGGRSLADLVGRCGFGVVLIPVTPAAVWCGRAGMGARRSAVGAGYVGRLAASRTRELLPRREADRSVCRSCFTRLEPWAGQPGPRAYSFTAREVAHLLLRVAEGWTYRSAAQSVRRLAGRAEPGRERVPGRRRSLSEGQLAAARVDCFADVGTRSDAQRGWPAIVVLDSIAFEVVSGIGAGRCFTVLGTVGHERPGAPQRACCWNRRRRRAWPSGRRSSL